MPNFLAPIKQNGVNVALEGHTHGVAIPRGTSFPLSPAQYDLFQRTDLGEICEYDGARWLGRIERVAMPVWIGAPPYTTSPTWPAMVPIGTEQLLILSFAYFCQVVSTNNASNYWSIYATNGVTNVGSTSTATDGLNPAYKTIILNSVINGAAYLQTKIQKTGTPGGIYISSAVKFRSVYT